MRLRRPAASLVLLAALACLGCGYRWVRYGGSLGDVRRVAIETLRNDSYEPGVEVIVTDALLREFMRRGAVRVVRDASRADLVLAGAVRPLQTRGRSVSSSSLSLEYEVELALDLRATRPDGREVPIHPTALREWELYLSSADAEAERKNRDEALRRVAGVLAARVHDALAQRLAP